MHFIMKFNKNVSSCSIIGFLKASLLCSSIAYSAAITDDQLEGELTRQFRDFKGLTIPSLSTPVCKAVQFIYSLTQNDQETNLDRKLALILRQGAGVGGLRVSGPVANEAERSVMFAGLNKAKQKGAKKDDFMSTMTRDPNPAIAHHQDYLGTIYDVLNEKSTEATGISSLDFVQSPPVYQSFNTDVKIHHAVKTNNWGELSKEVPNPEEFKKQSKQFTSYGDRNREMILL